MSHVGLLRCFFYSLFVWKISLVYTSNKKMMKKKNNASRKYVQALFIAQHKNNQSVNQYYNSPFSSAFSQ